MKPIIEETIIGKSDRALVVTVIGEDYLKFFRKVSMPNFEHYCQAHGLGLLLLKDYIRPKDANCHPYSLDPGYQRLLAPSLIQKLFPHYKFICDIDADCLPSPYGRDIFDNSNLSPGVINVVMPTPINNSRQQLGKRLALLRKFFHFADFPLDSLLSGSDDDEKYLLGFKYKGPISTLGTCLGSVDDLSVSGLDLYKGMGKKFSGYLQNYRNEYYENIFEINYLPYEFQAIWNYEVALNYPFLFFEKNTDLERNCVEAVLSRVDMLHFAGSWPENDVFKTGPFLFEDSKSSFYHSLTDYLCDEIEIKSYGRLKFQK